MLRRTNRSGTKPPIQPNRFNDLLTKFQFHIFGCFNFFTFFARFIFCFIFPKNKTIILQNARSQRWCVWGKSRYRAILEHESLLNMMILPVGHVFCWSSTGYRSTYRCSCSFGSRCFSVPSAGYFLSHARAFHTLPRPILFFCFGSEYIMRTRGAGKTEQDTDPTTTALPAASWRANFLVIVPHIERQFLRVFDDLLKERCSMAHTCRIRWHWDRAR